MSQIKLYALKVSQPLCDFFITSIMAKTLKEISFSEQLQYHDENGKLQGSQRKIDKNRLQEIGRYIDSVELSFPNSIVLAANYNEDGELVEDTSLRWTYSEIEKNLYEIIIPTQMKLAAIIDGQHRLSGFDFITKSERMDIEVPCSIFFDLPNSYQAYLFATINGNQKKVDKSLALEQFGFNVEEEPQHSWTPEKLAVYFVRQLNFKESPLKGNIRIAPKMDNELKNQVFPEETQWMVSTATIVDGILNLISSKPKRDRVEMAQENIWGKRSRGMVEKFKSDKSPLRQLYLDKKDDEIFKIIFDFLEAAKETVWAQFDSKSYIFKTVGVQALFDFLKRILDLNQFADKAVFLQYLTNAAQFDFSKNTIQASGIGRKDIRDALLYSAGLIDESKLSTDALDKIKSLMI
jgi:DNA phosphorothioation-associated DGQHR protein 1